MFNNPFNSFFHQASASGEVDADVTLASGFAVHGAWVDEDFGVAHQVVGHLLGGHACGTDVEPKEVGAFKSGDGALGQLCLEELFGELVVAVDVLAKLVEPCFTFGGVGCLQGYDSEGVDIAYFVDVDGFIDPLADAVVGNYDVGNLQTSDVEGFGG